MLAMALLLVLGYSAYYLVYLPYSANRTFAKAYQGSYSTTDRLAFASDSFRKMPGMSSYPKALMFDLLFQNREKFSREERRQVVEFVLEETQRTLDTDPRNVRVLSPAVAILQYTASPEGLERLEPLVDHLNEHAPEQYATVFVSAAQQTLTGNHRAAIRIVEAFEARSPFVPGGILGIKQAAIEALGEED